jgi:NAD(P)-dependent dehydrogenase (short-subunit alcohol dehydrogenase family)
LSKKMTHQLENKRIVVAGGTSGIGRALVDLLAEKKAEITAIGRDLQKLATLRVAHPTVRALALDARDRDGVAAFFEREGDIDHLVLAFSGSKGGGEFKTLELGELRDGFEQKFWPQLEVLQAALSHMRSDGSVTFITAISGTARLPGSSGLAAMNGALEIMVPILAKELKPMRVNAVSPGVIDTPWWDFLPADVKQGIFADFSRQVLVGRIGRAKEVADTVLFVLENEYINGTVIGCHGGI